MSENNYVIFCIFDNFQQLASIEHTEYQTDIDVCYSPWQNLDPISISFWYSDVALY